MASDNIWLGDSYFETSSSVGLSQGGDVTINLVYQANDYNDANQYIGAPEFPELKISTRPAPFGAWTQR